MQREKSSTSPAHTEETSVKWLPEEEEEIKVHMDLNVLNVLECIDECAAFLALKAQDRGNLFQGRTPKKLQDKCRTIRRKLSKSCSELCVCYVITSSSNHSHVRLMIPGTGHF